MKSTLPIRVMCVEDNHLVVDVIGRKLDGIPGFEWLGGVSTHDQLMAWAAEKRPHVVCMDVEMPGQDPFAMVAALAARFPDVRVLMLSGHVNANVVERAMNSGARGYVSKGDDSRGILDAIRRVAAGERVFSSHIVSVCGPRLPTQR